MPWCEVSPDFADFGEAGDKGGIVWTDPFEIVARGQPGAAKSEIRTDPYLPVSFRDRGLPRSGA